jgi:epsilon-lactone hydrolase
MSATPARSPARAAIVDPVVRRFQPPAGLQEKLMGMVMRTALTLTLKPFLGPPWPFAVQRMSLALGSALMPQDGRAQVRQDKVEHIPVERVTPKANAKPRHAILYLHGGAFVAGSPRTHRSITRYLAAQSGALVLVPDYRLAPEHRFPSQLEDCITCYRQLLKEGFAPERIAIVGDSAGGNLTFMTAVCAMKRGMPGPAALVMLSPAFSLQQLPGTNPEARVARDPMIRPAWGEVVEPALAIAHDHEDANPMAQDLSRLPPSLIQVGDDEALYENSIWLSNAATAAGREVELEIYMQRWHVFQAHAALMPGSLKAMDRQVEFIKRFWRP